MMRFLVEAMSRETAAARRVLSQSGMRATKCAVNCEDNEK